MIEVRIVPAEAKKSAAVYGAYKKGEFCVISGKFSSTQVASLVNGQANEGELELTRSTGGTAQCLKGQVFPIDKLEFAPEHSDSYHDTLASGDRVIYYTEGQFQTDCYDSTVSGALAYGTPLFVNTTGWLTKTQPTGATGAQGEAIALFVGFSTVGTGLHFDGTALYGKDLATYELL